MQNLRWDRSDKVININFISSNYWQVVEGGRLVLTLDDIHVTDEDTPPNNISIVIQTPPSFGQMEKVMSGESYEV